jgi:hypothetical protein
MITDILTAYAFCKEFGWTIEEFYSQPKREMELFAIVMSEYAALQNEERARAEAKANVGRTPRRR